MATGQQTKAYRRGPSGGQRSWATDRKLSIGTRLHRFTHVESRGRACRGEAQAQQTSHWSSTRRPRHVRAPIRNTWCQDDNRLWPHRPSPRMGVQEERNRCLGSHPRPLAEGSSIQWLTLRSSGLLVRVRSRGPHNTRVSLEEYQTGPGRRTGYCFFRCFLLRYPEDPLLDVVSPFGLLAR